MKQEAGWFKVLSEPIRLRLAVLLACRGETCVCELAGAVGEQHFKVSRHLGIMRSAGMVNARREGTWMYYSIVQPETEFEKSIINCLAEAFALDETVKADLKRIKSMRCPSKLNVLFLCTGNSCRSQMAEGWAKHFKKSSIEPYSAGVVKKGVDPLAVRVMREAGVDISRHKSKTVFEVLDKKFDYVITLCSDAQKTCPVFPGKAKVVHKGFDDPPALAKKAKTEKEKLAHYRRVRDEIRGFIEEMPDNLK
jgi:arsenate reductase (thioredoxin)